MAAIQPCTKEEATERRAAVQEALAAVLRKVWRDPGMLSGLVFYADVVQNKVKDAKKQETGEVRHQIDVWSCRPELGAGETMVAPEDFIAAHSPLTEASDDAIAPATLAKTKKTNGKKANGNGKKVGR